MFDDTTLKKYKIDENERSIGELEVNCDLLKQNNFLSPFIRENDKKIVTKIGDRNYEVLNQYIINCMNDYYNRLINSTTTDRDTMLNIYNRLYDMWQELHNYKKSNNLVEMDKIYDLFSYELYVLGYTD